MTVVAVNRDPDGRVLTILAEFQASAERVWQVWADPRQLERWWGPPAYPATFVDHDLRAGGRVTYYMTGPGGEKLYAWWRITSVDPPVSIEFEEGNADENGPTTSIRVRIAEAAGKTTMTINCRFHAPLVGKDTEEGLRTAVGQIDVLLEVKTDASDPENGLPPHGKSGGEPRRHELR